MSTLTDAIAEMGRRVEASAESVVHLEAQYHDVVYRLATQRADVLVLRRELKALKTRDQFLRSRLTVVPKALDLGV